MDKRIFFKVGIIGILYGFIPVSIMVAMEALVTYMPELIREGSIVKFSLQYIIWAVIFVPLWEELFFRKLIYENALKMFFSINVSMIISSLIFALMHMNGFVGIFSFILGIINCKLYEKFKTIIIPIIFHAASNLVSILDRNVFKQIYVNYGQISYDDTKVILIISTIFIISLFILFRKTYKNILFIGN